MFLSALWTLVLSAVRILILTAPIHCRGSTGEQVMECYISPNLYRWRNKLIYIGGWVNCQQIFIFGWTIPLTVPFPRFLRQVKEHLFKSIWNFPISSMKMNGIHVHIICIYAYLEAIFYSVLPKSSQSMSRNWLTCGLRDVIECAMSSLR